MSLTYAYLKHIDERAVDAYEYEAVRQFYEDRTAERSKVPLINHIHEGLVVLKQVGATLDAMRAWCLHPLFQDDKELALSAGRLRFGNSLQVGCDPYVMLLTMEYRYRANAWLSDKVSGLYNSADQLVPGTITGRGLPTPGDLEEVHHMLIADKVQNRKDFEIHHKGKHERSDELDFYFQHWLLALDVDDAEYEKLCSAIDRAEAAT